MHISYDLEFDLDSFIREMEQRSVQRLSVLAEAAVSPHRDNDPVADDDASMPKH